MGAILPYLTQELPGIGGHLKSIPEDFFVEEIPLYLPSGEGQHVYITLEKTGLTTLRAINMIARALGVHRKLVGYAGLKDAHAVTRQTLSVDGINEEQARALDIPGIKILNVSRHQNKLRPGHLLGNKFVIRVRGVDETALATAEAIITQLETKGVPNYFGEQRFGHRHNSQWIGKALVQNNLDVFLKELLGKPDESEAIPAQKARALFDAGDYEGALEIFPQFLRDERAVLRQLVRTGDPARAIRALDKRLRRLMVSAYQSHLFNILLAQRLSHLNRLETGDVAWIHRNGACFVVENAAVEQPRADAFELSPAGPLFGKKYLRAEGSPAAREAAVLADEGVAVDDFDVRGVNLNGGRRPYRIPLKDVEMRWDSDGLVVGFSLPPGAYATMVLREVMKSEAA